MRIAAVRMFVTDLGRAEAWYRGVLGASPTAGGVDVGFVVFDVGCHLVIEPVTGDSEIPADQLVGRFTGVSFVVADIEAAHRSLVARGVSVVGEPEPQSWGGVLATIADPDGNQMQLVQYP
jgi:predicted enzyme related to lactoylglutathione lyase